MGLVSARCLSLAGDQIARVAVAFLVFNRSHSTLLTGASVAASYLPWVVVAPWLGGLGDRFPRRRVAILADVYSIVLAALIAVPDLPTGVVIGLVFLLTCADPPFSSARAAMLPDIVGDDGYGLAQSFDATLRELSNTIGFLVGGGIVGALGARHGMLLDALTFFVSAVLIRLFVRERTIQPDGGTGGDNSRSGWMLVLRNPTARWSLAFGAALLAIEAVSLSLFVPWSAQLGHAAGLAGLIAASSLFGATLGALGTSRLSAARRDQLLLPLALLTFLLFLPFFAVHSVGPTLVLLFLAGVFSSFQVIVNQDFVLALPPSQRARAFGVAGTVINLGRGVTVLVGGALAEQLLPSTVVAITGVAGVVGAVALYAFRPRQSRIAPTG